MVVRAGALGDVLLLRRAVATLRGRHGRVVLLAPRASGAALVGPGPSEVDALVDWDDAGVAALFAGRPPLDGELTRRLRDVALALVYSRGEELARGLAHLVPQVVAHDPHPAGGHASAWLVRPLDRLGYAAADDVPLMRATVAEAAEAAAVLGELPESFIAVHPGSGSPAKNWPPQRFASLLDSLAPAQRWLLVEGPADAEAAAALARRPGAVVARGLGPRVLGAVLAPCGLLIGHDSGVSHLAAARGAPTLALFGPTDPAVWSPIGPRVGVVRSADGRMESLSVDAVVAEAERLRRVS